MMILVRRAITRRQARLESLVVALIVVNATTVVLGTVDELALRYGRAFRIVEWVSLTTFSIEFFVRVLARTTEGEFERPLHDRLGAVSDPYLLIDLLSIAPFYLGLLVPSGSVHSLTHLRIVRLCKLGRYCGAVSVFERVARRKGEELVVSTLGTVLVGVLAATAVYYAEQTAQPEAFSSIPAALWWAGVTVTTVGYGDVYPVTPLGRAFGLLVSLVSVGLVAVPSSILVSGFVEEIDRETRTCPHCGREV